MKHYRYLIVGGGMAASAAAQGIREVDQKSKIAILSAESTRPYDRPPLTKDLWQQEDNAEPPRKSYPDVLRDLPDGVDLMTETKAVALDPHEQIVEDVAGVRYGYSELLLATGGRPQTLSFDGSNQIIYFRTLDDYKQLRELAANHERFVVIGGGFIGSELAAALRTQDKAVTIIFPDAHLCGRIFPDDLGAYIDEYYRKRGIQVVSGAKVTGLKGEIGNFRLDTDSGHMVEADVVVAGVGIEPNVELAQAAGLPVDDGIRVNEQLRTSNVHIYAAGDAANFFDAAVGKRRRVEHEDNALSMGRAAGRIMAGANEQYDYSPMFYSDLFDLAYEAVGQLDVSLDIVADWQDKYEKGVLYYLDGGRLRGVLLWNVWDEVDTARDLIARGQDVDKRELIGAIGDWGAVDQTLSETFPASDAPQNW